MYVCRTPLTGLRILILIHGLLIIIVTWGNAQGAELSVNGFLQLNYSYSVSESNPDGGDFKWAEQRGQIKLDFSSSNLRLFSKADLYYDNIDRDTDASVRELYLDFVSDYYDIRVGRQIITWGLGDLIFINDTFPKDYEAYFSGRPLEYLKIGVDAFKAGLYPDFVSADLVIIPFFEPNNMPGQDRFWLYNPMSTATDRDEQEPATKVDNTEIALRLYRNISGVDVSVYFYRGFFRTPSARPEDLRQILFYPELSVYGFSLQGRAAEGLVSLEAGFYDSRQDRSGTDPFVPNSQSRFLIGYQRQLWEDFTVALQYYGIYMHRYSEYLATLPTGMPSQRRYRDLLTIRITALFMHQTLKASYFSFWSLSEGDYLLNPEFRYSFSDNVWLALGAMIFGGGQQWSPLGQFDRNDNLYLQMRYEF